MLLRLGKQCANYEKQLIRGAGEWLASSCSISPWISFPFCWLISAALNSSAGAMGLPQTHYYTPCCFCPVHQAGTGGLVPSLAWKSPLSFTLAVMEIRLEVYDKEPGSTGTWLVQTGSFSSMLCEPSNWTDRQAVQDNEHLLQPWMQQEEAGRGAVELDTAAGQGTGEVFL